MKYNAFDTKAEVAGDAARNTLAMIPIAFRKDVEATFATKGLFNPQPGEWFPIQALLDVYTYIGEKFGTAALTTMGKAVPDYAVWPPQITTFEQALQSLDVAYKMNHRGSGDNGYYKLISYDGKKQQAVMECYNPYPSEFDQGLLMGLGKKFKPSDADIVSVNLDKTAPTRRNGGKSCRYIITWM